MPAAATHCNFSVFSDIYLLASNETVNLCCLHVKPFSRSSKISALLFVFTSCYCAPSVFASVP